MLPHALAVQLDIVSCELSSPFEARRVQPVAVVRRVRELKLDFLLAA